MWFWYLFVATWWVLMGTTSAHAYLDPGTGGMMLQVLLAGLAGLGIWLKMHWKRVTRRLGLYKGEPVP